MLLRTGNARRRVGRLLLGIFSAGPIRMISAPAQPVNFHHFNIMSYIFQLLTLPGLSGKGFPVFPNDLYKLTDSGLAQDRFHHTCSRTSKAVLWPVLFTSRQKIIPAGTGVKE
jgi:hypothetical protein